MSERKTSGALLLILLAVVISSGTFGFFYGVHWFVSGQLRLCTPLDSIAWPDGHYKPPSDPRDLAKPAYWCVRQAKQAEAALGRRPGTQIGDYNDVYSGLDAFWGDDIISRFFSDLSALLVRWLSEVLNPLFNDQLVPGWNSLLAGDDAESAARRTFIAYLAPALWGALLGIALKMSFDWLQEVVFARDSQKEKTGATAS